MSRTGMLFALLLGSLALSGCGSDEPADAAGDPDPGESLQAAPEQNSSAPSIRIYMTDMEEYGEVAGVTASSDEFIDLTFRIESADGDPLDGEAVQVSSLVGNELSDGELVTDSSGDAAVRVRPMKPGEDVLTITADGMSRQLTVYITDEAYGHPVEHLEERATDLPDVDGTVSWDRIGSVETREQGNGLLTPVFDDDLKALDGQSVKVQGFMMPLENKEKQQHFMLTRTPPSCFYCLPGGPESVIEVKADKALDFVFDPVVLRGRMELLENSDMGLFYRLHDAEVERKN